MTASRRSARRCTAQRILGCPERSEQIQVFTAHIRALRRDIGICANIEADGESVTDKVVKVKQAERKQKSEYALENDCLKSRCE